MKSILLVLSFICTSICVQAQYYNDVLYYSTSTTPVNGVKLKTNLPFTNNSQMVTIMVEGYAYNVGEPINLTFTYYIYNGAFINSRVSTSGSNNPNITLANENGKVSIFIDSKIFYQRFHVRAIAGGNGEQAAWFNGWVAVDSTLLGTATANYTIPYQNRFAGNVFMPGSGIWKSNGSVGIGTANPGYPLDIYTSYQQATSAAIRHLSADGHFILINPSAGVGNWNGIVQAGDQSYIFSRGTVGTGAFVLAPFANGSSGLRMDSLGNVAIGTVSAGSNKLAVEGTIGARKMKVTQAAWADFVFHPDYQLPTLQEVERYINTNKHLQGIPTTEEIQKDGVDLGEMNKLLLQKVEELTLYMIEMKKEIEQLKAARK
jgi:hypothetical protein